MSNHIRIIPRIDIKGPNLLKPIQFDGQRVLGHPKRFADIYCKQYADELLIVDTVASLLQRPFQEDVIKKICQSVDIPVTICGGIRSIDDVRRALRAGADKVAINTFATKSPNIIKESVNEFGSQCIVGSIDYFSQEHGTHEVWTDGGRERTNLELFQWAKELENLGAGELLISNINNDGLGRGFDIENLKKLSSELRIPIIASCGAGSKEDFLKLINETEVSGLSAASVFHYDLIEEINSPTASYNSTDLRMGQPIDSGNIHFITEGYGALSAPITETFSVTELKYFLKEKDISIRIPREVNLEF